jgi:hypothetical protein
LGHNLIGYQLIAVSLRIVSRVAILEFVSYGRI